MNMQNTPNNNHIVLKQDPVIPYSQSWHFLSICS